jgi:hypothetical protein
MAIQHFEQMHPGLLDKIIIDGVNNTYTPFTLADFEND